MTGHMDADLRLCGSWGEFGFLLFTLRLIRTSHEVFLLVLLVQRAIGGISCNKAMVLLDIHFEVAHPANFVLWRWLRSTSRRSVCEIDFVDVERGCGIYLLGAHSTIQCNK